MKKINKVLLGSLAGLTTCIPATLALTSCDNGGGYIDCYSVKNLTMPKSGSTIQVQFYLKTTDYRKPVSAKFVLESPESEAKWLKIIGGPFYKGNKEQILYFSFCRDPQYLEEEFKTVKGHFYFKFLNEEKQIYREFNFYNFTFNIEE